MKWIPIDHPFSLPESVKQTLQKLSAGGHLAYVVGGAVRDFLLQRASKDFDIATSAKPEEILAIFPDAITVGKAFGVLKVRIENGHEIEVATFRKEEEYKDYRRPSRVIFAGPEEDSRRRDFTINGLFYDWKSQRILDCVGGVADIQSHQLRAIGDASDRFHEDALRLLRAIRFATNLGFQIEPATWKSIQSRCKLIKKIAAERVRDEINGMWKGQAPHQALELLAESGILEAIAPAVMRVRKSKDLWRAKLKALKLCHELYPAEDPALLWTFFLLDLGNEDEVSKTSEALKLTNEEKARVFKVLEERHRIREIFQMRESTLIRWVSQPNFSALMKFYRIDALSTDGNLANYDFCAARYELFLQEASAQKQPLLTGADLIQLGLTPGPHFTDILRMVEDLTLERKFSSKDEALEFVLNKYVR